MHVYMHHGASMHRIAVEPASYFQALSDPIRVRIVRMLADSKLEACLCDLSESLEEPDYKLSRHVKVLRQAGLLSAEKEGRWIYHKVVSGIPTLTHLYASLLALPDPSKKFSSDLKRLKKRVSSRESARCKTDSAVSVGKKRA